MVDALSPFTIPFPPPPSSSSSNQIYSIPMLYYALLLVGGATITLAIFNILIIIKRDIIYQNQRQSTTGNNKSFKNPPRNILSSFKYKKEVVEKEEEQKGCSDYECSICLMVYEEGEDVKKLPRCKHCFHACCIDMWLYSHIECPLCRTPVESFCQDYELMETGGTSSVSFC